MKVLLLLLVLATTLLSQVNIGYETTILPHFENDFDFDPDIQHKILIGNDYISVFVGYIPIRQSLSNKKATDIIKTMIDYKTYKFTQTYFSDKLNIGFQYNPTSWFGVYTGLIKGGNIELSNRYESLYNITEKNGIQFGFILTPKITENLYIGLGNGWNSITNGNQFSIQTIYTIK